MANIHPTKKQEMNLIETQNFIQNSSKKIPKNQLLFGSGGINGYAEKRYYTSIVLLKLK
jgi:hypothetical protein